MQHQENNTLVFTGGDPPEVMVRLTPGAVVVAEYSLEWQGPHTAIVVPITIGSVQRKSKHAATIGYDRTLNENADPSLPRSASVCRIFLPLEGLAPARAWRFESPLSHQPSLTPANLSVSFRWQAGAIKSVTQPAHQQPFRGHPTPVLFRGISTPFSA